MEIIDRAAWGAACPDGFGPAPLPAREVWLHHSVTVAPDLHPPFDDEDEAMRLLERIGQSRFAGGISYTFAVMPTGRVYEGHGVDREGAHTKDRNSFARGVVLVGNYEHTPTTEAQREGAAQLLAHGWRAGWWQHPALNGGHRQLKATDCPGQLGMDAIPLINARAADIAVGADPEGFLMALTDQQQDDLLAMVGALHHLVSPTEVGVPYPAPRGEVLRHIGAAESGLAVLLARKPGGVTAGDIADAISDELAADVVDLLAERIKNG